MTTLADFSATGVSFPELDRPDVNQLTAQVPDEGTIHLAILQQPYFDLIVEGSKSLESRFNTKRAAPYGKVALGDLVLLKETGQPVSFFFFVSEDLSFDLTEEPIDEIRRNYGKQICAQNPDIFWAAKSRSRYCTLVGIGLRGPLEPLVVDKKDQRGWVTFSRIS